MLRYLKIRRDEKYGGRSPVLSGKQGLILEYCMAKNMESVSKEPVAEAYICDMIINLES